MKNKNGGRTNTHNSISRETSVTHTVPPARQGSLTDRVCTATTIILHTGILSYTQTHTHTQACTGEKQQLYVWFTCTINVFSPWQNVPFPSNPAAQRHRNPDGVMTQLSDDMKQMFCIKVLYHHRPTGGAAVKALTLHWCDT